MKLKIAIVCSTVGISLLTIGLVFSTNKTPINKSVTNDLTYVVKEKDTIETIAYKFNKSVQKLIEDNNIDDLIIETGDKLKIKNTTTYQIEKNMSFDQIKNKFHITGNDIKKANNLKNENISNMKQLYIPNRKVYVVKETETIEEISKKFSVSAEIIKDYNMLKSDKLKRNTVIVIPNPKGIEENYFIEDVEYSNNSLLMEKIGLDIYKNKEYINYPKNKFGYYQLKLKDIEQLGYKEVNDYNYGCKKDDIIIYINENYVEEMFVNPVIINLTGN